MDQNQVIKRRKNSQLPISFLHQWDMCHPQNKQNLLDRIEKFQPKNPHLLPFNLFPVTYSSSCFQPKLLRFSKSPFFAGASLCPSHFLRFHFLSQIRSRKVRLWKQAKKSRLIWGTYTFTLSKAYSSSSCHIVKSLQIIHILETHHNFSP